MKCLLKLTPKVWLIQQPPERLPCKINTMHLTGWDGRGDRKNEREQDIYSYLFSTGTCIGHAVAVLMLPLFADSMMCMLLILGLHVSYVERMRVCTMLWSTPQCWKCRPWWLSSMTTSATQEIPWRVPRRSVRGQDGSGMWIIFHRFCVKQRVILTNYFTFHLLKHVMSFCGMLHTPFLQSVSHKRQIYMSPFTWPPSLILTILPIWLCLHERSSYSGCYR